MKIATGIRIASAIIITFAMIYFWPYMHTIINTLTGLATTLFPGLDTLNTTFLTVAPAIVLGSIIWWGISYAVGKMESKDSG